MKRIPLLILLALGLTMVYGQFSLDMETGLAFTGYNDLQIPNNAANSRLSFKDDLESKTVMYGRANLHYRITPRHELSVLYAPLTIKPTGTLDRDIVFMDETFDAGKKINATYRFDSYRLQYLYRFRNQNMGIRAVGLSIKVRDAEIGLQNQDSKATKYDTGVVPLIGFEFGYDFSDELAIELKGEALASKFGRAEDVLLSLKYNFSDTYSLYGGYRILEGGSDIDEVYTFAWINYATIGASIRF